MASKPAVRRTYGKASRPTSSNIFQSSSTDVSYSTLLSSPGPSSVIQTPPPSSPPLTSRKRRASPYVRGPSDDGFDEDVDGSENVSEDLGDLDIAEPGRAVKSKAAQSTLRGFFAPLPKRVKQPLQTATAIAAINDIPRGDAVPELSSSPQSRATFTAGNVCKPITALTQLHLTHLPLLHTCGECHMSYVRGGDDNELHAKHHARVTRGIPWDGLGRGRNGKGKDGGWRIAQEVRFGKDGRGKIIVADGSWGGSKLDDILSTVDTVLSACALPTSTLDACKVFLLVTASPPPTAKRPKFTDVKSNKKPRERVVGVIVAQGIKWAMRVLRDVEDSGIVDIGGGVICDPKRLPTPLGIHRLFTVPSYRGNNLAQMLLDAACAHTIYGCSFDPRRGQVAFSQPTDSGRRMMERWGGGGVRVFVDDESQLEGGDVA